MTDFINEFQSNLDLNDFDRGFEDKLYKLYLKQEKQNKHRIISKYFEYGDREENKKYFLLSFLKFLGKKKKFYDEDLVNGLKKQIHDYLDINTGFFDCFIISLDILFLIYDNKKYFKDLFNDYRDKITGNARILMTFCDNFLKMKEINYFFECIILILKTESRIFYEFEIRQRFLSLNNSEFKKYFTKLINSFSKDEDKELLKHYGDYRGLVSKGYSEQDTKIVNLFIDRIAKVFNKKEKTKIKKFLFGDLNFMSQKFLNIESNYFDNELFSVLSKEDENILFDFLKLADLRILSWHNAQFIGNNLTTKNVQKCINLYKEDPHNFFYAYLFLKSKHKTRILKIIKDNAIFSSLAEIEKKQKENRKKWEIEEKNRTKEWKKGLLNLTRTDDGFYANFLQDYYNLINNKENYEKFSIKEKEKLDVAAKSQSISCLKYLGINNYSDEKIKNILTFKENGEGSYSTSRYVHYLYWVLHISQFLDFNISTYYKSFIITYPILFGDRPTDDFLNFLDGKINEDDIDYILKIYSGDIYENAIGVRYYNYNSVCKFYERFNKLFSYSQENKLKSILLDFIKSDKVKYKDTVLNLYAKLTKEEEFKKIYKQPKINYFKSIISNEKPVSEGKKEEFKKQDIINKLLISKFHDINALLRRINQLKKGKIGFIDNSLRDGEIIGETHFVSAIENELEFRHEKENFAYVITNNYLINRQEIKTAMLEIFELGLKIENDIKKNKEKKDYKAYSYYLINIFYKYVDNLKNKKRYYTNAMNLIHKYPGNELNISLLNKHFGFNKDIINNQTCNNPNINKKKLNEIEFKKLKEKYERLREIHHINELKCFLFVEGWTDKIILDTAREKINRGSNKNFFIFPVGGARNFQEMTKHTFCENKKMIFLLDFDHEGFYEFSRLKNFKDSILPTNFTGLYRRFEEAEQFALTLPVPHTKSNIASRDLDTNSMLTIENLFNTPVFERFFETGGERLNRNIINLENNQKLYFAKDADEKKKFANFVKSLNENNFSEFKPLFEAINYIINGYSD